MRQVALVITASALAATALGAQRPLVLAKPDAEFAEPFSLIAGVRELKDGRVLVSDAKEKTLQLITFGGSAQKVARQGAGPGEYATPSRTVALPGDTSAVYDAGNTRYLTILPDGKVGKDFRLEVPGSSERQGLGLTVRASPGGVDARGNIYYQGPAFHLNEAGDLVPSDSSPIIRFDRSVARADTVAFTRLAAGNGTVRPATGGTVQVRQGVANPLIPRDDWVALPDGRIAVVRAADYHIDYYRSRSDRKAGQPVAYQKIRVDAAVRQAVEAERLRIRRRVVGITAGRGGTAPGSPGRGGASAPELPPLADWPEVMPPFLGGAAIARPNGQVWVLRTQKPGNDGPLYDVFDGTGQVIGHVVLPAGAELVGFGQGTVYLIRTDDDDLQYLQRYRLAMDARVSG